MSKYKSERVSFKNENFTVALLFVISGNTLSVTGSISFKNQSNTLIEIPITVSAGITNLIKKECTFIATRAVTSGNNPIMNTFKVSANGKLHITHTSENTEVFFFISGLDYIE